MDSFYNAKSHGASALYFDIVYLHVGTYGNAAMHGAKAFGSEQTEY
jgi:hypothetical protein